MVIGGKERYHPVRISLIEPHQAVRDRRGRTVILRLNHETRAGDVAELSGVITLVSPRQHDQRLTFGDYSRSPLTRLIEQRPTSGESAKLLGPVVARDLSSEGQYPLTIAACQNDSPAIGHIPPASGLATIPH